MYNSFSLDKYKDICGNDKELMRELVQIFINNYQKDLDALQESLNSGSKLEMAKKAHKLKGSLKTFYAEKSVALLQNLEDKISSDDFSDMDVLVKEIINQIANLKDDMNSFMKVADK